MILLPPAHPSPPHTPSTTHKTSSATTTVQPQVGPKQAGIDVKDVNEVEQDYVIVRGLSGGSITLDTFTKPSIHPHPHHTAYHHSTTNSTSHSEGVIECLDVDVKLPSLLLQLNDKNTRWLLLWATSLSPPSPTISSTAQTFGEHPTTNTNSIGGHRSPHYAPFGPSVSSRSTHPYTSSSSSSSSSLPTMASSVTLTQWEQEMHFDVSTQHSFTLPHAIPTLTWPPNPNPHPDLNPRTQC